MNTEPRPERALQNRCPHCLGEQWAMTVLAFSNGDTGCTVCGQHTRPMTNAEWWHALAETRRRRNRQQGAA